MLALLSLALPFHRGHSLQQQQANEVPQKRAPPKKSARLVQPSEQFDVGNLAVSNTLQSSSAVWPVQLGRLLPHLLCVTTGG